MKYTKIMAVSVSLIMVMLVSGCGEGAEEPIAEEEPGITQQNPVTKVEVPEVEPILNYSGDRLAGTPFHETSDVYYYLCDSDVATQDILDLAHTLINALAEAHGVQAADKAICSIKEGKPSAWFGQTVSIDYYINASDKDSCLFNDYCANFRTMTIMNLKGGLYGDVIVTSVENRIQQQSCYDLINGTRIADMGCVNSVP